MPLVDLTANYRSIRAEVAAAIRGVLQTGAFILGEELKRFEIEFARYCGSRFCVGVASGTDAIALALRALEVGAGDEVITVSHTFIATVWAILRCGATPVLVDIDPDTYTIDVAQVARAISSKTKAIIPVHLYGQPADMQPLIGLATAHGVAVVEDACQAHGATYQGRRVGSLGDAAAFSFYPSKNLGAYGDGGAVTTSRPDVYERLLLLRNYGQKSKSEYLIKGENSRLDSLQAAILRVKLPHLDVWNRRRQQLAAVYKAALSGLGIGLPMTQPDRSHVFHLFVVRVPQRDRVLELLRQVGIGAAVHYPIPAHRTVAYSELSRIHLPVTENTCDQVLSLPLYPELDARTICQRIVPALRHALQISG